MRCPVCLDDYDGDLHADCPFCGVDDELAEYAADLERLEMAGLVDDLDNDSLLVGWAAAGRYRPSRHAR